MNSAPGGGTWWRSPGWPIPVWVHANAPYLSNTYCKMAEMLGPSTPPVSMVPAVSQASFATRQLGAAMTSNGGTATPAPQLPAQGPQATPTLLDVNGNVITSAVCGSQYSLAIPSWGNKQVYIMQTKNGSPQFSGLMTMPMSAYNSICNQDEGTYVLQAFDPVNGALIGGTTYTILPAGSTATAAVAASTTSGFSTFFSSLSTTDWLLIGGGLLLLIMPGGRR